MKKIYCMIMALCIFLFPFTAYAADSKDVDAVINQIPVDKWPQAPEITSESALLAEANSGTILYAKNATQKMYPASTTKLMTVLLTLENCQLEDVITFSSKAVLSLKPGSSHIGLRVGESLTVKDCLYGLLLPSANEVANGLAERIGGSIENFIIEMNDRAKRLGAINTHFSNPNGLQDEEHYSCAYDLYLIMQACIKNPSFLDIASRPTYVREPDELLNKQIPMATTNDMLRSNREYYDPDVICGKTGWTQDAGRCLVTYASRDGMDLICVTMKTESPNQYIDTKALLDYGFGQFSSQNIAQADTAYDSSHLAAISPLHFLQDTAKLISLDSTSKIVLPKDVSIEQLEREISKEDEESGPTIVYKYHGYPLGTASILPVNQSDKTDMFLNKTELPEEIASLSTQPMTVINIWIVLGCALLLLLILLDIIAVRRHSKYALTPAKIKALIKSKKTNEKR